MSKSRDRGSQLKSLTHSFCIVGRREELLAAKDAVGLHSLHEDGERLPKERGNLVVGLAEAVVELSEDEACKGGAFRSDSTKGLDSNRN